MVKIEAFNVIGIAVRTTNENNQSANDIPALWKRFFEENITEQIPNKVNNNLYCLYTDYVGDFTKPYTTILGYAVHNIEHVPAGLTALKIPATNYHKTSIQGNVNNDIVINEWIKIWNSDQKRAYCVDFECYSFEADIENTQVDIYVSI